MSNDQTTTALDSHTLSTELMTVLDMMPQPCWIAHANGLVYFFNRFWCEYTGTTFDQLQGWGWIESLKLACLPLAVDNYKKGILGGESFPLQLSLRRQGGIFETFEIRMNPVVDENMGSVRWVGIFTKLQENFDELAELRISETQLQRIATMLPQMVWTAKADGAVDYFNERWFVYTGLTLQEKQGWEWKQVIHPDDYDRTIRIWNHAVGSGEGYEIEYRLKRHDGLYRWHLGRAQPLLSEKQQIIQWFGTCTDIHDKRTYSEDLESAVELRTAELLVARDEALAANNSKSRFLATVSHEIRTPMAGIMGLLELITESVQEGEVFELSKTALKACTTLLSILNDILDASKLQLGFLSIENRPFNLHRLLKEVETLITPEAKRKNLACSLFVDSDVPVYVCGDELRVRQVLQNLVFNAVKFTNIGHVDVNVALIQNHHTQITLEVAVTDTGIGISDEQKARLFKPFMQADDSTTRVYGGTGLGLNICKSLVDLMHGEIGVDSEIKKGCRFWVQIPFDKVSN